MENLLNETLRENAFKRRAKGTGTVYKLSGKRSKPYVAALTTGRNQENGRQQQPPIGYFATKNEAIDCLTLALLKKYNVIPDEIIDIPHLEQRYVEFIYSMISQNIIPSDFRDIKDSSIINSMFMIKLQQEGLNLKKEKKIAVSTGVPTVKEIWELALEHDLKHLSDRTRLSYKTAFKKNLKHLQDRKINLISYADLQPVFDDLMKIGTGKSKMNKIKIVLNYIFKYAMKYDYVEKNYASFIKFEETLKEEDKKRKEAFDEGSIHLLFSHSENSLIVQSILVMIYTGMRPSEFLKVKREDVHLTERYIIGGIKTENGINRIIPIHECIVPFIEYMLSFKNKESYLFPMESQDRYQLYLLQFREKIESLFINKHFTPHCCRHTFATLCNEYELNDFLVKKMIGHSTKDLTKEVYTHIRIERLVNEVNKIPDLSH